MIRVCYVLSTSERTGGANKSLLDLIRHLDRSEVTPVALLRRHGEIERDLAELEVPYEIFRFINSVTTGNIIKDAVKKLTYGKTLPGIKKYFIQNHIDIVHNNSLPVLAGMEAAHDLDVPYICHIRENVEKGLGVGFLDKDRHLRIAEAAAYKIAISEFIKDGYSTQLSNIRVLHDGMDTDEYFEKKEILNKEPIVVSIYGNLDQQKGQIVAVKAMEILKQKGFNGYVLNVVGNQETGYGALVRQYAEEHNVKNTRFIDNIVDAGELKAARRKDDINLVCSSAEGLGRVTIESMLAGNLTIGADAGATGEILTDGETGFLFETGNHEMLADLLGSVYENREKMRMIAAKGQLEAKEKFGISNYADSIQDIYKSITRKEKGE